jgi:hypothetical protein
MKIEHSDLQAVKTTRFLSLQIDSHQNWKSLVNLILLKLTAACKQ